MNFSISEKEFIYHNNFFRKLGKWKFAVIKVSGSQALNRDFVNSVKMLAALGFRPVVVHGAGKLADELMEKKNIKVEKINGLRKTGAEELDCVEQAVNQINKSLVSELNSETKVSSGFLIENPALERMPELGFVAKINSINPEKIISVINKGFVPVIGSIVSCKGQKYNINADNLATETAKCLGVKKLVLISDVHGVLDVNGKLIRKITHNQINGLITSKIVSGGMAVKLSEISEVLDEISSLHVQIVSPANLMQELFSYKGSGTFIYKKLK